MSNLAGRRAPVMFAVSGSEAIPGLQGRVNITREAAGIVIVTSRRLAGGVPATLGPHIMSPPWLPTEPLEERLEEVLTGQRIAFSPAQRVPGTLQLPAGLIGNAAPIVVVTLSFGLGLERLEAIGRQLRLLRAEGIVIVGIASETPAAAGSAGMVATVSVLLAATFDDDRVAELGTRSGGLGFILLPELHDALADDAGGFWRAEAAGEMPREILDPLRIFMAEESDESRLPEVTATDRRSPA